MQTGVGPQRPATIMAAKESTSFKVSATNFGSHALMKTFSCAMLAGGDLSANEAAQPMKLQIGSLQLQRAIYGVVPQRTATIFGVVRELSW